MQQTTKYKLDLIEKTDAFSPDALNQNMEKVEAAIQAETAALEQRVVALEAHKCYLGSYVGDGTASRDIDLGFQPKAVLLMVNANLADVRILFPGVKIERDDRVLIGITPNGFHVGYHNYTFDYNAGGREYQFLALY